MLTKYEFHYRITEEGVDHERFYQTPEKVASAEEAVALFRVFINADAEPVDFMIYSWRELPDAGTE